MAGFKLTLPDVLVVPDVQFCREERQRWNNAVNKVVLIDDGDIGPEHRQIVKLPDALGRPARQREREHIRRTCILVQTKARANTAKKSTTRTKK